jgi:hypothetical protein
MNLLYIITTYGVLLATAFGSNFIKQEWALAFIGAPLWGLLCYQWALLALVSVRVNSIGILEQKLLSKSSELNGKEKNQIGSEAGDRISRFSRQPKFLMPANIGAFGSVSLAAAAVAFTSLFMVEPKCSWEFGTGLVVHLLLASAFGSAVLTVRRIRGSICDLAENGPYRSAT